MLSRVVPPVIALACVLACIAFMGVPSAGCIVVGDGGASSPSASGDAGEGGSSASTTDASSGLVWGCADNGASCQCYSPAPAEYTQAQCITYPCCFSDSYVTETGTTQYVCQCANDVSCVTQSATAQRVSGCPH
jgi:hypothetical protein